MTFERNVVVVHWEPTDTQPPVAIHGNTGMPQLPHFHFQDNLYYNYNTSNADLGSTWLGISYTQWQAAGQDTQSLLGVDPLLTPDWTLPTNSPALTRLGFRPFNHSAVGPAAAPSS